MNLYIGIWVQYSFMKQNEFQFWQTFGGTDNSFQILIFKMMERFIYDHHAILYPVFSNSTVFLKL